MDSSLLQPEGGGPLHYPLGLRLVMGVMGILSSAILCAITMLFLIVRLLGIDRGNETKGNAFMLLILAVLGLLQLYPIVLVWSAWNGATEAHLGRLDVHWTSPLAGCLLLLPSVRPILDLAV